MLPASFSVFVLIPPPFLYAAAFGVGLILDWLIPWTPFWMGDDFGFGLGVLLFVASGYFGIGGLGLFGRYRVGIRPFDRPTQLMTDGPFAITRNPLYLSLTLGYAGIAIMAVQPLTLVFLVPPFVVLDRIVVPHEERRLAEAFGPLYADYRRRVRRWL